MKEEDRLPSPAELLALGSATLGESGGSPLHPRIKPLWPGSRFAGPVFTIECAPHDNLAIHIGLPRAPAGSVLAVSVLGSEPRGYWGEVLTTAAQAAGVVALVIDATVRDIEAIARLGFPVHGHGCALPGAAKRGPGRVGAAVQIGDVEVQSGDWLVGDADGVVCLPRSTLHQCWQAGQERASKESSMFDQLRAGATTAQLLGLDGTGIEIVG